MSLLILRLGPPRSARRRVSARQRVLQGGHQTHHHCTKAQKQDAKYRNTSLQNTEMQYCKHKNTSTQNKKIQTSWNKQILHKDKKLKVSARQSVLPGGHQGHHQLHQGAKTKCEIQKYKPLKYRNTDNLKSVNIARREKLNFIAERYKPCNYVTLSYYLNKICRLWIIASE